MKNKALDFQQQASPLLHDGEECIRMEWAIQRALRYERARVAKSADKARRDKAGQEGADSHR